MPSFLMDIPVIKWELLQNLGCSIMLKVFLVEDEAIIREGLRDSIPWQQYGYTFVGEAGDGEQALPLIRKTQPDILITDIKMPFMDGLALSKIVAKEMPGIKIIIISGYDDFEYARAAISIGVEQYLLKPVAKSMLVKTLQEVQQKIQNEREQENYVEKFRSEMQEYEQFSRRRLFEEIVSGALSIEECYIRAGQLNMDIQGPCYNLVLYTLQAKKENIGETNEPLTKLRDELFHYFMGHGEYLLVRQNLTTYAVLVKGEEQKMEGYTMACVKNIKEITSHYEPDVEWYAASGTPVMRLKYLPDCYAQVSRILAHRHLMPEIHILNEENTQMMNQKDEESKLTNLDMAKIDPNVLKGFLQNGQLEELNDFVDDFIFSIGEAAKSKLFCQYLVLNVRFTAIAYLETLGCGQEEFLNSIESLKNMGALTVSVEELRIYIKEMLGRAMEMRDHQSKNQYRDIIGKAIAYIEENYASETISLTEVANYTEVSANYFSAAFSQEMQQTFVEYLTGKRMEKAKELLRSTDKRTAEIAADVGYKDPHYFSFVFKKTQGCTPRDYKTGGKRG